MKDDTISRAAALTALGERPVVWSDNDDYTLGERNQYDMDKLAIETVPSAQPVNIANLQQNCNQIASDCISRAAAINAICEDGTRIELQGRYSMTMVERKQRDVDILENLPSAQPEHLHIVMEKLNKQYEKAINNPFVIKPMAWALYQVWKEYDR